MSVIGCGKLVVIPLTRCLFFAHREHAPICLVINVASSAALLGAIRAIWLRPKVFSVPAMFPRESRLCDTLGA